MWDLEGADNALQVIVINLFGRLIVNSIPSNLPQDKYYVYTLCYPDGTVFYVGKGQGNRIDRHEYEAKRVPLIKTHKCNVIRKVWASGGHVVKKKLAHFHTEEDAYIYEIALIFFMNGLTNITNGGKGASGVIHGMSEVNKTRKLTDIQIREIREKYGNGWNGENLRSLAMAYGVSHEAIRLIVGKATWKHI